MTKIEQLKLVREKIFKHKYPKVHIEFAGAGLIVTDVVNRTFHESDIVVYHPNAQSLSWLVYQLKSVFQDSVDAENKYEFYGQIGDVFLECLKFEMTIHETMIYMVGWAEKWISNDEFPKIDNSQK
jgi:hypothetical protein